MVFCFQVADLTITGPCGDTGSTTTIDFVFGNYQKQSVRDCTQHVYGGGLDLIFSQRAVVDTFCHLLPAGLHSSGAVASGCTALGPWRGLCFRFTVSARVAIQVVLAMLPAQSVGECGR